MSVGFPLDERYYWSDWKRSMRGAPGLLKTVFFLYPSKEDADNSRERGASGFFVGIPSKVFENRGYVYAITNRHVIEEAGASVIRLNTKAGGVDVIDLKRTDWQTSTTDDLAAWEVDRLDPARHDFEFIPASQFLTPDDIQKYQMGPGMEVYVVGRFVSHSGKQRNQPAARFGVVSMLESEPVRQSSGHLQESVLVEMHSISGYSGSPVDIYVSRQTPGTRLTMGFDYKNWLLGVDWGHIPKWEYVVDQDGNRHPEGWRVKINSGMMGVVPAWRLLNFLNSGDLMAKREQHESAAQEEKLNSGVLDAHDDEPEKSVFTKGDFEEALRKVSRKIEPDK